MSETNGLIDLTIDAGWEIQLPDGILSGLLGLDDGLGGVWLEQGNYQRNRPINFTPTKSLQVHLEQLSTSTNFINGSPSSLLALVQIDCIRFGTTNALKFDCPKFKRLSTGTLHELKVTIRDDTGRILDNHNLPISVVLEVQ